MVVTQKEEKNPFSNITSSALSSGCGCYLHGNEEMLLFIDGKKEVTTGFLWIRGFYFEIKMDKYIKLKS